MGEPIRILLAFLLAAAPAVLLCRVMMSLRIMDAPTEARKIQRHAVPTSGGLAVMISAYLATVAITEFTDWNLDSVILVTGAGALSSTFVRPTGWCWCWPSRSAWRYSARASKPLASGRV